MKTLFIESTHSSPLVVFDDKNNTLKIEGISLPENPYGFYSQIYSLIDEYENNEIIIIFDLKYVNSSSYKSILLLLKNCKEKIKNITIKWYFDYDDEYNDMIEIGQDIEELLNIKFEYIPKK